MVTRSAPTVQRRLAAIVAADVAGYTRLMERHDAETLARLKALRQEAIEPILARYGGRIVDLKGDGAISFVLKSGQADNAGYVSSEGSAQYIPQLVIELAP